MNFSSNFNQRVCDCMSKRSLQPLDDEKNARRPLETAFHFLQGQKTSKICKHKIKNTKYLSKQSQKWQVDR